MLRFFSIFRGSIGSPFKDLGRKIRNLRSKWFPSTLLTEKSLKNVTRNRFSMCQSLFDGMMFFMKRFCFLLVLLQDFTKSIIAQKSHVFSHHLQQWFHVNHQSRTCWKYLGWNFGTLFQKSQPFKFEPTNFIFGVGVFVCHQVPFYESKVVCSPCSLPPFVSVACFKCFWYCSGESPTCEGRFAEETNLSPCSQILCNAHTRQNVLKSPHLDTFSTTCKHPKLGISIKREETIPFFDYSKSRAEKNAAQQVFYDMTFL